MEEEEETRSYDQNKYQIKKPRTIFLKRRERIENPPSLMEVQYEFKKTVDEKKMGFLINELRKIEEAERRSREQVFIAAEILYSLKKTPLRVFCDEKQEKTKMAPSSSSSHSHSKQKKRKRYGFVRRDHQSILPVQSTSPPMPVKIQEAIKLLGGTPPVWLTQKILTDSDVKDDQGRLFIPTCEALEKFMTDEEQRAAWVEKKRKQIKSKKLGGEEKKKKEERGVNVILVNPMGDQEEVSLRIWASLRKCVFTKTWKSLCQRFNLLPTELKPSNEKHNLDLVQLWCFRLPVERDSKLCFAINIIKNINVQLGDAELDGVDQSREMAISKCIEPSFDHFEARPLKKHCSKVEF